MDTPQTPEPEGGRFAFRFTIGQLMLVVLLTGLALAPVSMYRQNAPVELIVVTVAFETIGLPTIAILLLLAIMAPGPRRTQYIVILSAAPVLLIFGAFVLAEISAFVVGTGLIIKEALHGNVGRLFQAVYIILQSVLFAYLFLPPRCPSCRRFRLLGRRSFQAVSSWQSVESMECRACGGHFRRQRQWIFTGRLRPEPETSAVPEIQYIETHDS